MTKILATRKGQVNRRAMTVKLAFNHMSFEAVEEWVKAYRQLDSIKTDVPAEQIELLKTKFKALEKVFEHMFPKIKEVEQATQDIIELESLESDPSNESTESLIESLEETKQ